MTMQRSAPQLLDYYANKAQAYRGAQLPVAAPPPLPPPPIVQGYATARLLAQDRPAAIRAINRGLDRWLDEFQTKIDTMWLAMGWRRQTDWQRRLSAYLQKPMALWQEQAAKFPRDFEEDWGDFQTLRLKAQEDPTLQKQAAVDEAMRIVAAPQRQAMIGGMR